LVYGWEITTPLRFSRKVFDMKIKWLRRILKGLGG